MKTLHFFILFIFILFVVGFWDIKKSYENYKNTPSYGTISGFYSSVAAIILSIVLLILYLIGYINI
jgi:hypothetical protein